MNNRTAQLPVARHVQPPEVVLVALDGSAAAATALPVAQRLAHLLKMPLHVLHVATSPITASSVAELLHLDAAGASTAEIDVRAGDPSEEILRAVKEQRTYLTVLTTHGREIEADRHLGHVAEQVIASTMRPILLIRPEAAAAASTALEAKRFLLPLDGKAATARALGSITDIVCRLGGSFDVLFIADPVKLALPQMKEPGTLGIPRYVDQPQHEWPAWMREVLDYLGACSARHPLGVPARVHVVSGPITSVVLQFVAEHLEDVIVLVRRSHLEPGRAEVLRALLDETPCPVLLTGTPVSVRRSLRLRQSTEHPSA
ncbi:MAG TPA: universal stress protein [Ktedonobacterales bacterium]|nr:universal stress protein [Ktedonobacterales bacterium]